jgi:5-methylcytosine-specific restriction protein A
MPSALLRACGQPGCPGVQPGPWCDAHRPKRSEERFRPNLEVRRWYRTARWARLRAKALAKQPFCPECEAAGRPVTDTTDVDHVIPHRGDPVKFWEGPLQALCASCHSTKTRRESRG